MTNEVFCACGCGNVLPPSPQHKEGPRFLRNHHWNAIKAGAKIEYSAVSIYHKCACGCGQDIIPTSKSDKYRDRKYIMGHQVRLQNKEGRSPRLGTGYKPTPDEIPSGLCGCGCGGKTSIAKQTKRDRRQFVGYPIPFIPGHRRGIPSSEHHLWKGGKTKRRGYIHLFDPDHPGSDSKGYIPQHRVVMEGVLNRFLAPNERVHHKNGKKDDNRQENLELWKHKYHPPGVRAKDYHCNGCRCGEPVIPHCPTCTCTK